MEALLAERDMERSEMMELHAAAALKDQSLNQLKASYDLVSILSLIVLTK